MDIGSVLRRPCPRGSKGDTWRNRVLSHVHCAEGHAHDVAPEARRRFRALVDDAIANGNKKPSVGVLRWWAREFGIPLFTRDDLHAVDADVDAIPHSRWVVPSSCGRIARLIERYGACTMPCATCAMYKDRCVDISRPVHAMETTRLLHNADHNASAFVRYQPPPCATHGDAGPSVSLDADAMPTYTEWASCADE